MLSPLSLLTRAAVWKNAKKGNHVNHQALSWTVGFATMPMLSIGIAKTAPSDSESRVRVAGYNVLFGNWGRPQRIGEALDSYNLDIIGFSEVPGGNWTAQVGHVLGMEHAYVGAISSANHQDKYKSVLCRFPLTNGHEIEINAAGWAPASMVGADTIIHGMSIRVYSLHIPGRPTFIDKAEGSAAEFIATEVIPRIDSERFIIMGDFNNHMGDAPLNRLEEAGMRTTWRDIDLDTQTQSTHKHIETGSESGVIDHILYNAVSGARACNGGIIQDAFNPPQEDGFMSSYRAEWEMQGKPLSDHRPIWAELAYPRQPL